MTKKYTINIDALVIIGALFLGSVLANIYLVQMNSKTGKKLLDAQGELALQTLNTSTARAELKACQAKLDAP